MISNLIFRFKACLMILFSKNFVVVKYTSDGCTCDVEYNISVQDKELAIEPIEKVFDTIIKDLS